MNPLDNTPKNGDFAAYVESLVNGRTHLPGGAPHPTASSSLNSSTWGNRIAEVAKAATAAAAAKTASDIATSAAARGAPMPARESGANSAGQMPSSSPTGELLDMARPHLGRISRILGGLGVLWFVLGAVANLSPFADSIPVAILLFFAAAFLHNQIKRPGRTA